MLDGFALVQVVRGESRSVDDSGCLAEPAEYLGGFHLQVAELVECSAGFHSQVDMVSEWAGFRSRVGDL